jgi:predicted secreted protein
MKWTSMLAIFVLFWTIALFVMLPIGVRTAEEEGHRPEPGHAESAPYNFSFGRVALRTTILAGIAFGIFYANYVYGWIDANTLGWTL